MPLLTAPATSLPSYVEKVIELSQALSPDKDVWFRGVNDRTLTLLPGAYWRSECEELSMYLTFRSQVPSYVQHAPGNEWEWYYLAQHYGIPTRLLDWTESALAALYFALDKAPSDKQPAVWMLVPSELNDLAIGDGSIYVPPSEITDHWLPTVCGRGKTPQSIVDLGTPATNKRPLAIYPARTNPRIVAQRGTFTVHGTEEIPIFDLLVREGRDGIIARIDIESDKHVLLGALGAMGVDRTALFPEPQSVAEDVKFFYGVV